MLTPKKKEQLAKDYIRMMKKELESVAEDLWDEGYTEDELNSVLRSIRRRLNAALKERV